MANDHFIHEPPPGPPLLLDAEQVQHLAYQGWTEIHIPDDLENALGRLSASAADFFGQSEEVKTRAYPSTRGTESGFYHVPNEKEYLTLRRQTHDSSCELEQQAARAWHDAGLFLYRVLCDLARACGLDTHVWDPLVKESLCLPRVGCNLNNVTTLMRLFRYNPATGTAEQHADIGLLTLCVSNSSGLQVLDRAKQVPEWIYVSRPTVLIGETARSLLCNRVRAGLHRVVGNEAGRDSIVVALRPYLASTTDLSRFGGQGIVDTRKYYNEIRDRRFNVNATQDIREQQRKTLQAHDVPTLESHGPVTGLG